MTILEHLYQKIKRIDRRKAVLYVPHHIYAHELCADFFKECEYRNVKVVPTNSIDKRSFTLVYIQEDS